AAVSRPVEQPSSGPRAVCWTAMSRSHQAPGATTSRRAFIRVAGLLGLGTSLLSACGPGVPSAPTAAPAPATAAPAPATAAPAAAAPTTAPAAKPTQPPAAAPTTVTAAAAKPATGEATLVLGVDAESLDPM